MKTILFLLLSSVLVAAQSISERLQKGLFEEEAKHNLPAAIEEYKAVIAEADEQRRLTATAIFRLAESYRKLGRTNEALPLYERVLRDFSDQTQLVQRASARLPEKKTELRDTTISVTAHDFAALGRLLDNSPDLLNSPATNEMTFLQWAALRGDIEMIDFLIKRGAKPDRTVDKNSQTPLMSAVQNGHKRAAEVLIKAGTDVNTTSGSSSALIIAARKGYLELIKLLLQNGADANLDAGRGFTALHSAASSGQVEAIELLVESGAKLDALWESQASLGVAAGRRQAASVAALLRAGADPNNAGRGQDSPLVWVLNQPTLEVFDALMASPRVDVNAREKDGTTALIRAVEKGFIDAVEALIKRKADLNSTNSFGDTALHMAAGKDQIIFLETLLKADANPNVQNVRGLAPLHVAAGGDRRVPNPSGPGNYQLQLGQPVPAMIELLLKHKANPNLRDGEGRTPLYWAVSRGSPQAAAILLDAQADPNAADLSEYTPLDYSKQTQMHQLLIKAGATNSAKYTARRHIPSSQPPLGGTIPPPQ